MRFDNWQDAVKVAAERFAAARRVYICGNGGSAANANHIANDFINVGIRAQSLVADVATLTAIANDYGYEYVFKRQLAVLAEPGEIVLFLSGSGNSKNIIEAAAIARARNLQIWAMVGAHAQLKVPGLAHNIIYAGKDMQEAEELQLAFGHAVMRYFRDQPQPEEF